MHVHVTIVARVRVGVIYIGWISTKLMLACFSDDILCFLSRQAEYGWQLYRIYRSNFIYSALVVNRGVKLIEARILTSAADNRPSVMGINLMSQFKPASNNGVARVLR